MSASEFEAVLGQACIKIDKVLYERGGARSSSSSSPPVTAKS
jgi:hypothetical protein